MTLLSVENLRVTFATEAGLVEAVRGVSFSLGRERLGIGNGLGYLLHRIALVGRGGRSPFVANVLGARLLLFSSRHHLTHKKSWPREESQLEVSLLVEPDNRLLA